MNDRRKAEEGGENADEWKRACWGKSSKADLERRPEEKEECTQQTANEMAGK